MEKSNIFERNPIKTIVITIFCLLFITDIAAALLYEFFAGYKFHLKRAHIIRQNREYEKQFRIASDIYSHDFKKNAYYENASWGGLKYPFASDSLGFKTDMPHETPLKSNRHRIVFIGDSFTEGIGIRHKDTFVGQINSMLSKNKIDVFNAGIASYSPIIYYRKIKYLLDQNFEFNEVAVYIDISDIEDEAIYYEMSEDNTVILRKNANYAGQEKTPFITKVAWKIKVNSILTYYIIKIIENSFLKRNEKTKRIEQLFAINIKRSRWTFDEEVLEEYGKAGLEQAKKYMDKLSELLKLNNIKLTIAVYPWPDQILNDDLNSLQTTFWKEWAKKNKVNFINYFPCLINPSSNNTNAFDVMNKYFIKGDVHLNEDGHQIFAREFVAFYNGQECKCADSEYFRDIP